MRFNEFRLLHEGELSELIVDDADHEADSALIDTLREIQFSSDHAQVPKISVEALINLVRTKPGGESFSLEALMNAKKTNDAVKNIIGDIKDDENGIKYVFINPVDPAPGAELGPDGEAVKSPPEKTVSSMANRALDKRT